MVYYYIKIEDDWRNGTYFLLSTPFESLQKARAKAYKIFMSMANKRMAQYTNYPTLIITKSTSKNCGVQTAGISVTSVEFWDGRVHTTVPDRRYKHDGHYIPMNAEVKADGSVGKWKE